MNRYNRAFITRLGILEMDLRDGQQKRTHGSTLYKVIPFLLQQKHIGLIEAFTLAHTSTELYQLIRSMISQHPLHSSGTTYSETIDWAKCEGDTVFRVCSKHNNTGTPGNLVEVDNQPRCVLERVREEFLLWLLPLCEDHNLMFSSCAWVEIGRGAHVEAVITRTNILANSLHRSAFNFATNYVFSSTISCILEGLGTSGSFDYAFDMVARLNDYVRQFSLQNGVRDPLVTPDNNDVIHPLSYSVMMRFGYVNDNWEFLTKFMEFYFLEDDSDVNNKHKKTVRRFISREIGCRSFEEFLEMKRDAQAHTI